MESFNVWRGTSLPTKKRLNKALDKKCSVANRTYDILPYNRLQTVWSSWHGASFRVVAGGQIRGKDTAIEVRRTDVRKRGEEQTNSHCRRNDALKTTICICSADAIKTTVKLLIKFIKIQKFTFLVFYKNHFLTIFTNRSQSHNVTATDVFTGCV